MAFCPQCGNVMTPADVFCMKCGARAPAATGPTPPANPASPGRGKMWLLVALVAIIAIVAAAAGAAVLLSAPAPSGFSGIKVFAHPDIGWNGTYLVTRAGSLNSGMFDGTGNAQVPLTCAAGSTLQVTIWLTTFGESVRAEVWVRGSKVTEQSATFGVILITTSC